MAMTRIDKGLVRRLSAGLGLLLAVRFAASAPDGEIRFDFETGDLQGWTVVEGALSQAVTDRPAYHNGGAYTSRQGRWHLSTVEGPGGKSADVQTAVLESPVFVLQAPELSFLLGGGASPDTYVALCTLNGREVQRASGQNAEAMQRVEWQAAAQVGQPVFLRVVDAQTDGWGHVTFDDFAARGTIDPAATQQNRTQRKNLLSWIRNGRRGPSPEASASLRAAIEDLIATFGRRYPGGRAWLARLDALDAARQEGQDPEALAASFETLQREALVANPLVSGQPLLYVNRPQYAAVYHAIDTLFQVGEATEGGYIRGGALKLLDVATGRSRTLVETPEGTVRSPCLHFDGRTIFFSMRRHPKENLHLFQIRADGTGLKQLTFAEGVSDFDPMVLPDDSLVFSSTREPKFNMCSQDIGANLFRMDADGANIHRITRNTLFENQASVMPDGRILYKRWEYVDRNFGDAHGFWTVNPDGTRQAVVWGNNQADPAAVYYPRVLPGNSGRLLCILGTHHGNMGGALGILDPRRATDGKASILRTWPTRVRDILRDSDQFDCDRLANVRPRYEDPWPLSEKYFLCSRTIGQGQEMGIYLVDLFGNEVLLHAEAPGCFSAMPLQPSARPPVLVAQRTYDSQPGYVYVQNVYQGTHMQNVKPGAVKRLRIVESPEKRAWTPGKWFGQGFQAPGMNWHDFTAKRIIGTVPVEDDGSAYFTVPADTFLFFQLLDENGMMIHSMRSGTVLQAGERTGCVGCHENRHAAPPPSLAAPKALRRPASEPAPWRGPARPFSYVAEVQPVFDRHCLACHDFGGAGAQKLILAGDKDPFFNASYTQLWRTKAIKAIGAGPAGIQQAYSWGSHASRLIAVLKAGHQGVQLSADDLDRLVTWIDLNAPYYPTYSSAYPDHMGGRSPLDDQEMHRLGQLTGIRWDAEVNFATSRGPWVSFDRPELSPCLAKFSDPNDPAYREALALIRLGQERLAQRPRGDLADFQPCERDARREVFFEERQAVEQRNREAIRDGRKVYDDDRAGADGKPPKTDPPSGFRPSAPGTGNQESA